MYIPNVFKADEIAAWAHVTERAFGTVVATTNSGAPMASHVPFVVSPLGEVARLAFHVARANPLHGVLANNPRALIIVSGPDAYISPDWYVSVDQVPTWNYVSVHLTGMARVAAPEETLAHVDHLSAQFERRLAGKKPWTSAKMTAAKRDAMLKAIVVLEFSVEKIEAQWKLGQHKTVADQANVLRMLEWRGDWASLGLAEQIRRKHSKAA
jgi:transcriptional regulator